MTNTEEQFYKTFEIEPTMLCGCEFKNLYDYRIAYGSDVCIYAEVEDEKEHCSTCRLAKQIHPLYPVITDRILLELICILNSTNGINCTAYESKNIKDLEKEILNECIEIADDKELKQQVQALFKGEE